MNMKNNIRNVYLYVRKNEIKDCIKYGMKLSEYSNITFNNGMLSKRGILAYIAPKDSSKYNSDNYDILRVKTDGLVTYVNNSCIVESGEEKNFKFSEMCSLSDYRLGKFINPEVVICSSILPENIFKYNRIIDVPLLIDNSRELYLDMEADEYNEKSFNNLTFDMLKNLNT